MGKIMGKISCLFLIIIIGCGPDRNDPEIISLNQNTLSGPGEEVGTVQDGRKIIRYEIEMGANVRNHFVYMIDDVVTVNHVESHGKVDHNHVEVFIDNQKYSLVPIVEEPND